MVDTTELKNVMARSGLKTVHICRTLGISGSSYQNKLHNRTEFTYSEVMKLCRMLNITDDERTKIFCA